jgi:hypothetical protein
MSIRGTDHGIDDTLDVLMFMDSVLLTAEIFGNRDRLELARGTHRSSIFR